MALVIADRVKESTTTSGTGVITLAGAATGFQSFAVIGNGNTTFYCIAGQGTNEWEVGIGTYATSGTTLTRTTVLSNSSATQPSALSFAAGTKDVFVTYPSEKAVSLNTSGVIDPTYGGTGTGTYTTGDILYASATNTLSKLPAGTVNYVLTSNGANTAPSYQFAGNAGSTAYEEYPFTATAAQTTFAVGVSMTLVNVFLNGLRLLPTTDYSISGTDIVLTTGAAANDILSVLVYFNSVVGGTVTTASVVSANGFAGTVANPTTTPAITLKTSITGVLKGNGTAISAATSGTDYAPGTSALATGIVKSTTMTGALTIAIAADFPTLNQSTTGSAATLTTSRAIYGNNFDGSVALAQVIASTYGGTGNGFSKFSGATTSEKTYTLPNASTTILTTNAAVTEAQGGTNQSTYTTGDLLYASAANTLSKLSAGTVNYVLTSGGAGVAPSWAVGSGMTLLVTDTFSTAGTFTNGWSKNASAKLVVILNIGAGGGGASGGAACNTALGGQGGGGAGAVVRSVLPATILGSTETYVVGAKGTGGASVSRTAAGANASTVGNPGNAGTNSSFGSWSVSKGGAGGTVNTTNNSTAGGGLGPASTDTGVLLPIEFGGNGGDGGATDNAPLGTAASTTVVMSSGGGSGGGVGVSGTQVDGLGGGLAGSTTGGALGAGAGGAVNATGTAGGAGNVNASGTQSSGGGGGGNATSTGITGTIVATAGAGGNAGGAGGGGGGGGAARVATTTGNQAISGKGGDGGDGKIIVYQFG